VKAVREGRIEEATSLNMGPLVYLNEAHFEWFIRKERKEERIVLLILAVCELLLLFFWFYLDFHLYGLVFMVLLPVTTLPFWYLTFGHLHYLDGGVAVHENGVDMVNGLAFRVSQVFVPWDEIEDIFRNIEAFGIVLRHTGYRLRCNTDMVDELTENAIISMKKWVEEMSKPPELHIYPSDGRKAEGVHAAGSPE